MSRPASKVYFFSRQADGDCPAGITVSKRKKLPTGDFRLTEYTWDALSLWFIDADKFTADERQATLLAYTKRLVR